MLMTYSGCYGQSNRTWILTGIKRCEKVKIQNTTDIPIQKINDIIAFVKPNNLPTSKFTVKIMNSELHIGSAGICYTQGTGYTDRPLIKVRLSRTEKGYPYVKSYTAQKVIKEEWQEPNKKTGVMETWYRKHGTENNTSKIMIAKELVDILIIWC
jgi:hypothetical protein